MTNQTPRQRLVTLHQFSRHMSVSERTVRNWISEGHFPAYRVPGVRGVVVDLDDAEAAIRRLPSTKVRPGFGSFGPNADIRTLNQRPIVVEDEA